MYNSYRHITMWQSSVTFTVQVVAFLDFAFNYARNAMLYCICLFLRDNRSCRYVLFDNDCVDNLLKFSILRYHEVGICVSQFPATFLEKRTTPCALLRETCDWLEIRKQPQATSRTNNLFHKLILQQSRNIDHSQKSDTELYANLTYTSISIFEVYETSSIIKLLLFEYGKYKYSTLETYFLHITIELSK